LGIPESNKSKTKIWRKEKTASKKNNKDEKPDKIFDPCPVDRNDSM
jgi:hypothetical protein